MTEQAKAAPQSEAPNANQGQQAPAPESLEARLQAAEKARDEYLDLARQTRADFENYQKRSARDLATERRYAQAPLAGDLLPSIDNLERALTAAKQGGDKPETLAHLVQGINMVQSSLLDVLRRHGVTRIDAQGKPFDPNLHQAVMQQPSADVPPNTVLQVLEQGYMLHERVLRPARVIVSAPPS
jgi:molecular chaperone GrpE